MKIDITELEYCKVLVHYEANALEIMDKRAVVQEAFKKAPVPGFRANKAPMDAIKMHYRTQIDDSLKRALAEDSLHNTIFEKKLRIHGPPKFNNMLLESGKFLCEFEAFLKPDVELSDWKSLEIPKPHETEDATIISEKMIQELRERLGDAVPYGDNDFVQSGDHVIVDYLATIDGQKVDSLSAEGEMMTIGKSPLEGFDNNLLGMVPGEMREFDFNAPEGGLPSISGKTVHFQITLATGSKNIPCALDDEMAKKMGKKDLHELQELVAQTAFARVGEIAKMKVNEAVARRLVTDTQIKVPNWMSLSEAQYLAQQSKLDWNAMQDSDKEKFFEVAEQNVKLSLILDKVREDEPEAQLSDQEVFDIVKQNLANTKMAANMDDAIQQMNRTGQLQIIFARVKDEYAMDFITKTIKLID